MNEDVDDVPLFNAYEDESDCNALVDDVVAAYNVISETEELIEYDDVSANDAEIENIVLLDVIDNDAVPLISPLNIKKLDDFDESDCNVYEDVSVVPIKLPKKLPVKEFVKNVLVLLIK